MRLRDGNKLDFSYMVPPCYSPAHHRHSPQDSIRAMGDVYQTIWQTIRALKLNSATQVCPGARRRNWRGWRTSIRR